MRIRFLILVILVKYSQCDLVILKFKHSDKTLDICALKKPISPDTSIDREIKLINLVGEDGCHRFQDDSKPNTSAYYLHVPTPRCSFTDMATNIQEHEPSLVIIGTDGPIVKQTFFFKNKICSILFLIEYQYFID